MFGDMALIGFQHGLVGVQEVIQTEYFQRDEGGEADVPHGVEQGVQHGGGHVVQGFVVPFFQSVQMAHADVRQPEGKEFLRFQPFLPDMADVEAAGMFRGGDQPVQIVRRVAFQVFQSQVFRCGQIGRDLLQGAEDSFRLLLRQMRPHVRSGDVVRDHVHDPGVRLQFPREFDGADDVFRVLAARFGRGESPVRRQVDVPRYSSVPGDAAQFPDFRGGDEAFPLAARLQQEQGDVVRITDTFPIPG